MARDDRSTGFYVVNVTDCAEAWKAYPIADALQWPTNSLGFIFPISIVPFMRHKQNFGADSLSGYDKAWNELKWKVNS